jgi:hypothetical protein
MIAELLRLYHDKNEAGIVDAMSSLVRRQLPLVKVFGDKIAVTTPVKSEVEILLLLSHFTPGTLDRRALGKMAKLSPPTVTRAVQWLEGERYIHINSAGRIFMSGPGEQFLADEVAKHGIWSAPIAIAS